MNTEVDRTPAGGRRRGRVTGVRYRDADGTTARPGRRPRRRGRRPHLGRPRGRPTSRSTSMRARSTRGGSGSPAATVTRRAPCSRAWDAAGWRSSSPVRATSRSPTSAARAPTPPCAPAASRRSGPTSPTWSPPLADRVDTLESMDDVKWLDVRLNRLRRWSVDGLLCIGDAAHAMSPVGGVGINLAVQDAVATATLLAEPLRRRRVGPRQLARGAAPTGRGHASRPGPAAGHAPRPREPGPRRPPRRTAAGPAGRCCAGSRRCRPSPPTSSASASAPSTSRPYARRAAEPVAPATPVRS